MAQRSTEGPLGEAPNPSVLHTLRGQRDRVIERAERATREDWQRFAAWAVGATLLAVIVFMGLRTLVHRLRARAAQRLMKEPTPPKPHDAYLRPSSWEEEDDGWASFRGRPQNADALRTGSVAAVKVENPYQSQPGVGVLELDPDGHGSNGNGADDEPLGDLTETEAYRRYFANDPWKNGTIAVEAPAAEPEAEAAGNQWKGLAREIVETALLTLLIFVVIRALGQNFRIEGYSMEPNLHEQQYLIVSKVSYYLDEPQRGDIIVFEYHPQSDPNPGGPEKDFIKRIIGLPGDTVECRPGEIIVNGQVIEEPYGPNPGSYSCPPMTLGPDEYFVLGDNRNQSSDSHQWGALERQYIIGKAVVIYWPFQDWGRVPNYPIQAPSPSVAQTN